MKIRIARLLVTLITIGFTTMKNQADIGQTTEGDEQPLPLIRG